MRDFTVQIRRDQRVLCFASRLTAALTKQVDEQCLAVLTPQNPFEVARIIFEGLCRWVEQERQKYSKSEIGDDAPTSYVVEDFKGTPLEYRGIL